MGRSFQIGLKVWSVNTGALPREAARLYQRGVFDYIELYAVPGTIHTLAEWQQLNIPFVIHAAHFKHGFNLAKADCLLRNKQIYDEMRRFADALNARYIIFHGGTFGDIQETARQLAAFHEDRALIENKPCITRNNGQILECRGASPGEIRHVVAETGCGFCLDIPHALCAANYLHKPQDETLQAFQAMQPAMYHLADMMNESLLIDDHSPLGSGCLDMRRFIPSVLAPGAMVTIETNRRNPDSLAEFEREVAWLRQFQKSHFIDISVQS